MSLIDLYQLSCTRLRRTLAPISRIFMAHEPPYILHVFEPPSNEYRVPHWASQIESMQPNEYSDCSIIQIDHRKNLSNKEHEFLVATISHLAGYRCYLKIHRCVEVSSASDSSTMASPYVKPPRSALDLVEFISEIKDEKESIIVGSVSFNNPNAIPSIPNLSILLSVVHAHAIDYHPRHYNCYWYAHTVVDVLRRNYRGVDDAVKPAHRAQKSKLSSIIIRTKDSVGQVETEYSDALKAWKQRVDVSQKAQLAEVARVR